MKKSDVMDELIAEKLSKMLASRAERFDIVRRKPMHIYNQAIKGTEDYDISLLIEAQHLETYDKTKLMAVIVEQIETLERDLSEIKLNINTECRVAATFFIRELTEGK